jgi:hypothetical protein
MDPGLRMKVAGEEVGMKLVAFILRACCCIRKDQVKSGRRNYAFIRIHNEPLRWLQKPGSRIT